MQIPDWRVLRQPGPLAAGLVVVLAAVVLAFRWWDSLVEDRLGRWAVEEVARQTDSTYRLALGDLSFLPFDGSIGFDSAAVITDSSRNRRRAGPLPALEGRAEECRISGLDLVRLALRRSFSARSLECKRVVAGIALAARAGRESGAGADTGGMSVSVHQLVRPLGISAFRIARISFPSFRLNLAVDRPGPRGGASLVLEHARFDAEGIAFDPRGASAETARLAATGLVLRPDTLIELAVARLQVDFLDSTLSLTGVKHEPAIPEDEWLRRVRVRRDRISFALDSLEARGVAYRGFLAGGAIGIRALELRNARLDVLTDRRIPKGPPRRHRTPQQVAVQARSPLRLDTVLITGGSIVYRERKPKTGGPGVVSFERVRGAVHGLALPPRGAPLRIEASARLMGEGLLTARASVPLDAPDFRYELSGTLEAMPAKAFNRFLAVNESYEFDAGLVEGIAFRQVARGGRAVTAVTPRYRDVSVQPAGEGGGLFGSVKRAVEESIADALVVRSHNTDQDGKELRTGRVARRYAPERTWLQFVWEGLREGLTGVLKE